MIKKIYIVIILNLLIISCGKKSDPIYKEKVKNTDNTITKVML